MTASGARGPSHESLSGRRSRSGTIVRLVLVLAVLALLVIFARTVNWSQAWSAMREADRRWLAAAAAANALSMVLKGVRWWVFLRPVGVSSLPLALRATLAGAGLNNILVANGGEAARIVFVSRASRTPGATILATLAIERAFDLLGYVILLAGATLLLPLPPSIARWRIPASATAALSLFALAWVAWRARCAPAAHASGPPSAASGGMGESTMRGRVSAFGGRFMSALATVTSPGRFAAALALSLAAWGLQVATFSWTAHAAGLALPLAGDVATLLAANLGFLVRATPGNVGLFQLTYAVAAQPFGAPRDAAIAVALLIQILQIVPITLLGAALAPEFLLRRARRR